LRGDGIAFSKKYGRISGARIHTHEKFGTAVIIFPDGFKIDVASARMEYYKFPAALPVVEMSSIKLDLYRRDFTINTLAIQLNRIASECSSTSSTPEGHQGKIHPRAAQPELR